MYTSLESLGEPEKLSPKQRVLRGIGGVLCAAAGVAVMKYMPYDAHDSMALAPMLTSGLFIATGVLESEAIRGVPLVSQQAEDSE